VYTTPNSQHSRQKVYLSPGTSDDNPNIYIQTSQVHQPLQLFSVI
jgi:hypothetical protein